MCDKIHKTAHRCCLYVSAYNIYCKYLLGSLPYAFLRSHNLKISLSSKYLSVITSTHDQKNIRSDQTLHIRQNREEFRANETDYQYPCIYDTGVGTMSETRGSFSV